MAGWLTARFPNFSQDRLLLVIDLIGTFVFAVEGALAGMYAGLDVFGLLVLSFVTALGGGTIRDVLDWRDSAEQHSRLAICGDCVCGWWGSVLFSSGD